MEKQKIKKNKREMGKRQKAIEIQKKERIKARARDPDKHNQRERGNNRKKTSEENTKVPTPLEAASQDMVSLLDLR